MGTLRRRFHAPSFICRALTLWMFRISGTAVVRGTGTISNWFCVLLETYQFVIARDSRHVPIGHLSVSNLGMTNMLD